MIQLKTKRLMIRDPKNEDIEGWNRLISDPKTMYYLQDIKTSTKEESHRNLEVAMEETENPNRSKYFLAIEHRDTGDFMGSVGYTVTRITPVGKLAGIGYFLLPEYHRQGFMTGAVREVIRFGFGEDDVYRFSTGCLKENQSSEHVMQKCGMIQEAVLKSHTWHGGQMKDRVEYRLLKDEWLCTKEIAVDGFWNALDKLVSQSKIVIDRPKGSRQPNYPNFSIIWIMVI